MSSRLRPFVPDTVDILRFSMQHSHTMTHEHVPRHAPQHDRIDDLLVYLITEYDQNTVLTRTKLLKLAYLADKRHYNATNHTITGVTYSKYASGPYCDTLVDRLEDLNDDRIHILSVPTDAGSQHHHEPCCQHCQSDSITHLEDAHIETLDSVLEEYAPQDTTDIVEEICTTEPVQSLEKYAVVPMQ